MKARFNLLHSAEETRQERELRKIRERRTGENVPYGEREIDNSPTANAIPVDAILRGSYRRTDSELG